MLFCLGGPSKNGFRCPFGFPLKPTKHEYLQKHTLSSLAQIATLAQRPCQMTLFGVHDPPLWLKQWGSQRVEHDPTYFGLGMVNIQSTGKYVDGRDGHPPLDLGFWTAMARFPITHVLRSWTLCCFGRPFWWQMKGLLLFDNPLRK